MTELSVIYKERYDRFLQPVASKLRDYLDGLLKDYERLDSISSRAKDVDRFVEKAAKTDEDGNVRYGHPLDEIQDQVGARIVTYFNSDVQAVSEVVTRYFKPIEDKVHVPDEDAEFGYMGKHFIVLLPTDIVAEFKAYDGPQFFELQIHTLFQHAWAEAGHDLGYKPAAKLTRLQKRKIAFTAAQAWGADMVFDELAAELQEASAG